MGSRIKGQVYYGAKKNLKTHACEWSSESSWEVHVRKELCMHLNFWVPRSLFPFRTTFLRSPHWIQREATSCRGSPSSPLRSTRLRTRIGQVCSLSVQRAAPVAELWLLSSGPLKEHLPQSRQQRQLQEAGPSLSSLTWPSCPCSRGGVVGALQNRQS